MANSRNKEPEVCEVPRWQLIKATLDNLNYTDFVNAANADPDAVMIDVRTQEEHDGMSIPGSKVINYLDTELADKLEVLDKTKNYYIYCRTGRRSLRVCVIMRNLGFQKVYNLEDGITSMPTS